MVRIRASVRAIAGIQGSNSGCSVMPWKTRSVGGKSASLGVLLNDFGGDDGGETGTGIVA